MKPHFLKDAIGNKIRWLKKIPHSKEAYITSFDFRTIDSFPKKHILKTFPSSIFDFFRFTKQENTPGALILTFEDLTYNEINLPWSEIKGIYELYVHHNHDERAVIETIILKTKNKKIHRILPHFLKTDSNKVSWLISAYKTRWDICNAR